MSEIANMPKRISRRLLESMDDDKSQFIEKVLVPEGKYVIIDEEATS